MAEVRLSLYQAGRPETLPNVCVRCGAEAAGVVRRQFVWHPPPGVGPVRNRKPDLFEGTVLKMLAKRPEHRHQTAGELVKDLERVGKYQGVQL